MATKQLAAKLVMCSVPTRDSAAAKQFYNALLGGTDFARTLHAEIESYYRPISKDGLTLTITPRQSERETLTCYFAVDNLDETVEQLQAAGGKVIVGPNPIAVPAPDKAKQAYSKALKGEQPPATAGRWVGMTDPDGNYLALMQLDDSTKKRLQAEPQSRTLSQQQVDELDSWRQHGEPAMG